MPVPANLQFIWYTLQQTSEESRIVFFYFPSGDSALVVSWLPPPLIFLALSGRGGEVIFGAQISFTMAGRSGEQGLVFCVLEQI